MGTYSTGHGTLTFDATDAKRQEIRELHIQTRKVTGDFHPGLPEDDMYGVSPSVMDKIMEVPTAGYFIPNDNSESTNYVEFGDESGKMYSFAEDIKEIVKIAVADGATVNGEVLCISQDVGAPNCTKVVVENNKVTVTKGRLAVEWEDGTIGEL